jgi:hypothetical protein
LGKSEAFRRAEEMYQESGSVDATPTSIHPFAAHSSTPTLTDFETLSDTDYRRVELP